MEELEICLYKSSGMNDYQAFVIQRSRSSFDTPLGQLGMVDSSFSHITLGACFRYGE